MSSIEFQPWVEVTMTTGGIIVAVWLVYRATSWFLHYRRVERTRQEIRRACQSRLDELSLRVNDRIAGQQPSVSKEFDRVTQLSLEQLLNDLRSRRVTAKTVLTAFQLKALSAHGRTNCVVEPIKEAEEWADELDSTSQTPTGALHGLPVSIKEYFGIKGYDGTLGLYKYLNKPAKEDSVLIKVLKAQGAIPFVKTNTPHAGLSYTTRNPVYGITNNPVDSTRGAGGSSGGEAALLALNGSPLGFGSDLGGSIRNPSHFCGTYGLKPTSNRISKLGTLHWNQLSNCLPVSFGPMARDVDSLAIAMKAVLVPLMFQLDRSIPPMPFNNEIYTDSKPLRIGYYTNSGLFQPVQSCSRAVEIARDVLEKQGKHTLVPWSLPSEVRDLMNSMPILYSKIIVADEGKELLSMIEGDNATDDIIPFTVTMSLPRFVRTILAHLLRLFDKQMGDNLGMLNGARNVAEWWHRVEEVQKVREVFDAAWEGAQLDALVCPAFSCPALSRDLFIPIRGEGHDLMVFNMMDVPAGIVPVTVVTADDVNKTADYPETYEIHRHIKKGMQGAEGLPIGVQVVAPRYQEELCLRVMKDIETGIKMKSK